MDTELPTPGLGDVLVTENAVGCLELSDFSVVDKSIVIKFKGLERPNELLSLHSHNIKGKSI
jgi:hypothetical protein